MKMFRKNIKLFIGISTLAFLASCKPEIGKDFSPSNTGNVDFSKYIAIGNSLTAGYADGGLYLEGQQVAFPNLIAEKMKTHGGGSFVTPFFSEAQSNGSGYLRLKSLENGRPVTESVTDKLAYTSAGVLAKYTDTEINNLGIPGMRLDHSGNALVSAANMYFKRLLPDNEVGSKSYQDFANNRNHTFFTFWLGNNDVLGYASNGAVDDLTGTTGLTPVATFKTVLTQFIDKLTVKGQKGVVATVPDVTLVPYFTTVTRKAILESASALAGQPINDIYIATKTTPRAATDNDLFILPFSSLAPTLLGKPNAGGAPYGFHPANPIEDKYVLDSQEAANLKNHITQINAAIKEVANSKSLAVVDVNTLLTRLKTGVLYNGFGITSAYITGNAFSLDGIHLTPIGQAMMANMIIESINSKYGTKLEKVDVSGFRGVKIP